MTNVKALGISKLKLHNLSAELDKKIEASCEFSFEKLILSGNYSLKPPFGSVTRDLFEIKVFDLEISGKIQFEVDKSGKLKAKEIEADADVTKTEAEFAHIPGIAGPAMKILNSGDKTVKGVFKNFFLIF